jgi:predicted phosphohydrolase
MNANFKRTFVIAGNHEYYGSSISETDNLLRTELKRFENIRLLQNEIEIYDGYCFVGTTLWTKIKNPAFEINDTDSIRGFSSSECTRLNALNTEWLKGALSKNKNCVVITHHMPSESLIDEKYKTLRMKPYNQWFCCDLDDLILANKDNIKCWIYGHTHSPSAKTIEGVPFLCNPIGYPGENEAADFSKNIVLR